MPDDGTAREHAIKIMGEVQKHDEAGWTGHMMEVTRERRVVWRDPIPPSFAPCFLHRPAVTLSGFSIFRAVSRLFSDLGLPS
jgi:hypothetical protein